VARAIFGVGAALTWVIAIAIAVSLARRPRRRTPD
jgi:predicted MFS family arabinose efflux permease